MIADGEPIEKIIRYTGLTKERMGNLKAWLMQAKNEADTLDNGVSAFCVNSIFSAFSVMYKVQQ